MKVEFNYKNAVQAEFISKCHFLLAILIVYEQDNNFKNLCNFSYYNIAYFRLIFLIQWLYEQ